jgi:chromosome partition protein MukB
MSRARATALALVNWKGVFYERYLLDRHVTALEGANGAGKTTVMIAAYVVLLPDLSRLRFTNVGESGATGGDKGIWGRLGDAARPSYAAMEVEIAGGERVIAGVLLRRKAEPSLELTPFLVTGGSGAGGVTGGNLEAPLRDLLLVAATDGEAPEEMVPDLDELRANVARAGAHIEVFASTKDYFGALFERGITPLRLGTDEERNKLNEMLRTSMTGGISRALTTDLRGFLLKEDAGLGDALTRMRANLDACHRTRVEVGEARRLERELVGVHDAGQAMFVASMLAARTSAGEHAASVERSRRRRDEAGREGQALDAALDEAKWRHRDLGPRVETVRVDHDGAVARLEGALRARTTAARIRELEAELSGATERAGVGRDAQEAAVAAREARRRERDQAGEACDRAARGLADLQGGLDELHRNLQAHRQATRRLAEVREALGDPAFDAERAGEALERTRAALSELDERRVRLDQELESASVRRAEHARAMEALTAIAGPVAVERAHDEARRALARLSDLQASQERAADLAVERDRAAALAGRQSAARVHAAALGIEAPIDEAARHVEQRLAEAEGGLRAAEDEARAHDAGAEAARRAHEEARRQGAEAERAAERWRELGAIAARLETAVGMPARSRAEVTAARVRLSRDREMARGRAQAAKRQRDELLEGATILESPSVAVSPGLLRLRDELDAELLAARFEDLDLADASRAQAALGPLMDALVVEDLEAAARKLAGLDRDPSTVWLIGAGASIEAFAAAAAAASGGTIAGGDLVMREPAAMRVTRLPEHPTLGRRARERRAADLRGQADALAAAIETLADELRALEALSRDVDTMLEEGKLLDGGDPAAGLALRRENEAAIEAEERRCTLTSLAARKDARALRPRVEMLRALLGEAFLLEPPDHAARARELSEALERTASTRQELRRTEGARRSLALLVEVLRAPPPTEDEAASLGLGRDALQRERERLFRAGEALEQVARNRHALAFGDLEGALKEQGAVAPALETQLAHARQALQEQEQALRAAEASWEQSTATAQRADAERGAIQAQVERARAELGTDPPEISESSLALAQEEVARLRAERAALAIEERALATEIALLGERRAQAAKAVAGCERALALEIEAAAPAAERWTQASLRMEAAGALRHVALARAMESHEGLASAAFQAEARSRAEVLVDRLTVAAGATECVARVRGAVTSSTATSTDAFLDAWLLVAEWIKRRLPAPLGEHAEPLHALGRLRHELEALEERLARQDADLRGSSEDVARGIDVQLRRASHQVRRLNQHLEGVRFGGIAGIRAQMRRIERMDQVLVALREGAAQDLLFRPTLPIEEALDEIFRRYGGGGRGGGGARILDYREYVELGVEVRRRQGGEWEAASPARLSTGEAIGVGAALMMVILTEWERDANLLRARKASGSLRLLFLDEANRLSQDNLAALFDLCQALDLQLLIAAPEVARADGNTTYRLVRRVGADGGEEVLVTGRRTVATAADA